MGDRDQAYVRDYYRKGRGERDLTRNNEIVSRRLSKGLHSGATGLIAQASAELQTGPGKCMGDFQGMKEVGRGSFGTVFRARSNLDGKYYVIKRVQVKYLSERQKKGAVGEVLILRRLSHKHIIRYHNAFVDNQTLHIVMEYATGGDLHKLIGVLRGTKRNLHEIFLWKYFFEMCEGLQYLHNKKIIHRDVKTLNILLSEGNTLKFGDFGVSRLIRPHERGRGRRGAVGTPLYMAPETIQRKQDDYPRDVWALGIVMHYLTCLQAPFTGRSTEELRERIQYHTPASIPAHYSAKLQRLVLRLLRKEPGRRPTVSKLLTDYADVRVGLSCPATRIKSSIHDIVSTVSFPEYEKHKNRGLEGEQVSADSSPAHRRDAPRPAAAPVRPAVFGHGERRGKYYSPRPSPLASRRGSTSDLRRRPSADGRALDSRQRPYSARPVSRQAPRDPRSEMSVESVLSHSHSVSKISVRQFSPHSTLEATQDGSQSARRHHTRGRGMRSGSRAHLRKKPPERLKVHARPGKPADSRKRSRAQPAKGAEPDPVSPKARRVARAAWGARSRVPGPVAVPRISGFGQALQKPESSVVLASGRKPSPYSGRSRTPRKPAFQKPTVHQFRHGAEKL